MASENSYFTLINGKELYYTEGGMRRWSHSVFSDCLAGWERPTRQHQWRVLAQRPAWGVCFWSGRVSGLAKCLGELGECSLGRSPAWGLRSSCCPYPQVGWGHCWPRSLQSACFLAAQLSLPLSSCWAVCHLQAWERQRVGIILSLLVSKKVLAGWQGPDQGVRWGKTGPALGESRGKTWSGVL